MVVKIGIIALQVLIKCSYFVYTNLVIEKSNIATKMKTESDEHNATNNILNAFLMSGFDKMKILRAFPTKAKMPKID